MNAADEYPEGSVFARRVGSRTTLSVPLLRGGVPIGVIHVRRSEVRAFTDRQIRLLETFAAQAVIAIENSRLFTEVQSRNRDLTEALEQVLGGTFGPEPTAYRAALQAVRALVVR
jgi:GAF domain-containing protein